LIPTATAWLAELRAGHVTAAGALADCLAAIERDNRALNAVVAIDRAGAEAAARACDAARARGERLGPLAGLPLTVKDVLDVAGLPTTAGDPGRAGAVAAADAPVVARLRAAGAIPFGKTNVPLNAADFQTSNELFGATGNPWDARRSPGGSSGGAAAAVAAGLTPVELGTDLAGSLRLPAHYCGVASLKPSLGVVPVDGVYAGVPGGRVPSDLLVAGPLARCVADLALLFDVIAGPDARLAPGWRLDLPRPPAGFRPRVALWLDDADCPPEPAVATAIRAAAARLADVADVADVGEVRPPWAGEAFFATHLALLYAAQALAAPAESYDYFVRRDERWPEGGNPLASPTALLAAGLTLRHRDWLEARERQAAFRDAAAGFFADWDVVICPAAPTVAPLPDPRRLDRRTLPLGAGAVPALRHAYWAAPASSLYLPAVTVPVGLADGLPVGAQVIAPFLHDHHALAVAALLEAVTGGYRPPPGF
jgi:amidase